MVRTIRRIGACGRITRPEWLSFMRGAQPSNGIRESAGRCRLCGGAARDLVPPVRQGRRALGKGDRRKLAQRALVYATLEVDDLPHRIPEIGPSPLIEL